MMREVFLKTLPNATILDISNNEKNIPIMSVTGSINQNVFKFNRVCRMTNVLSPITLKPEKKLP